MKLQDTTCSGAEIADLLNITPRRVRQLAEKGLFPRAGRDRYLLGPCIRNLIAALKSGSEKSDLRSARIALINEQRRRLEIQNHRSEATVDEADATEAACTALSTWMLLAIRPLSTWAFQEMQALGDNPEMPALVAGRINEWVVRIRHDVEMAVKELLAEARRQGLSIRSFEDLEMMASYLAPENATDRSKKAGIRNEDDPGKKGGRGRGKAKSRKAGGGVRRGGRARRGDGDTSTDGEDGPELSNER